VGAGGTSLILIVGFLLLPRGWPIWLLLAAVYAVYVWFVDWSEPVPRYDVTQLGPLANILAPSLVAFWVLMAWWGVLQAYRRITGDSYPPAGQFCACSLVDGDGESSPVCSSSVRGMAGNRPSTNSSRSPGSKKSRWPAGSTTCRRTSILRLQDSEVMARVLGDFAGTPAQIPAHEFFTWSHLNRVLERTDRLQALSLVDLQGRVILSTDANEKWTGLCLGSLFPGRPERLLSAATGLFGGKKGMAVAMASLPVHNACWRGGWVSWLAHLNLASLNNLLGSQAWVGETGENLFGGIVYGYLLTDPAV